MNAFCSASLSLALCVPVGLAQSYPTERTSLDGFTVESDGVSQESAPSADGRYVAFATRATNFSDIDPDFRIDLFLRDRWARTLELLSVGPGGAPSDGDSRFPVLTPDAAYVAFESTSSTFFPGDDNAQRDVFVRDRAASHTALVSANTSGDVGNGSSGMPAISDDGRWVAFVSNADDLVPGDSNNEFDVFLRDRLFGTTRRVSVGPGGVQTGGAASSAPAMTPDAKFIAYASRASDVLPGDTMNFTHIYLWERTTGNVELISRTPSGGFPAGHSFSPSISADGRLVAYSSQAEDIVAGDTNFREDVFVYDRASGTTTLVSVSSDGVRALGDSFSPSIERRGERVVFASTAPNLAPGDTDGATVDLYARNLRLEETVRQSLTWRDRETSAGIRSWRLSADGNWATIDTEDGAMAPDDTNGLRDSYIRWVGNPLVEREPNNVFIDRTWINLDAHGFGAVSGKLAPRGIGSHNPDTYMVAFDKQDNIVGADDNSSTVGDGKASALWLDPIEHGDGTASVRLAVTGRPDGVDGAPNGLFFNAPHGQLGAFEVVVRYYDSEGFPVLDECEEPIVDRSGDDPADGLVFQTGAELFRLNFIVPEGTVSAHVEIDNTVGRREVCDDVDRYTLAGFPPLCDVAITVIGCLGDDGDLVPVRMGWFNKNDELVTAVSQLGGKNEQVTLSAISDASGRVSIGITGAGDTDFDGLFDLFPPRTDSPGLERYPAHGACCCYTLLVDLLGHEPAGEGGPMRPEEQMAHGDLNLDGGVDVIDLAVLLNAWGAPLP